MWDLAMQPSLTAAVMEAPDVLSLLLIVFVGIVGLAAALVVLEAVRCYGVRRSWSEVASLLRFTWIHAKEKGR